MKKILLVFGFLLLAAAFSLTLPCTNQLFALSGCCMQRSSYGAQWSPNGLSFMACRQLNQSSDGDNVFDQRGLVWWNVNC
ncbi:MAG: hypothetical protein ACE5JU_24035 [Candidatus Binatia bacterium]